MDPEKGYYNAKEDSITVQVNVVADAPHGVRYVIYFIRVALMLLIFRLLTFKPV